MTSSTVGKAKGVIALYEKALKPLHAGRFAQARKVLVQIQEKFPDEEEVQARVEGFLRLCDRRLRDQEPPKSFHELADRGAIEHNQGNYEKALEFYAQALKKTGAEEDQVYRAIAATEAKRGNAKAALKNLRKAIELNEVNRFQAQSDSDFEPLFANDEFRQLVDPQRSAE